MIMERATLEKEIKEILNDTNIQYYVHRIDKVLELYAKDDETSAIVYNVLGDEFRRDHDAYGAHDYYLKSVELFEKLGTESLEMADLYEKLALSCYCTMLFDESEDYYKKALQMKEKLLGENHPDLAQVYNNFGNMFSYNHNMSTEYHLKALSIRQRVFGENHLITAESYYNLGTAYAKKKDYSKGLNLLNKALAVRIAEQGEQHYDVAMVYGHIGGVYYEQEDYAKALEYFTHAYEILKKTVTAKHPDAKQMKKNIDATKKILV